MANDGAIKGGAFLEIDAVSQSQAGDIGGWESPMSEMLSHKHRGWKGNDFGVSHADFLDIPHPGVSCPLLNLPGERCSFGAHFELLPQDPTGSKRGSKGSQDGSWEGVHLLIMNDTKEYRGVGSGGRESCQLVVTN